MTRADFRAVVNHGVGIDDRIIADDDVAPDAYAGVKRYALTDAGSFPHGHVRCDGHAFTERHAVTQHGRGMYRCCLRRVAGGEGFEQRNERKGAGWRPV